MPTQSRSTLPARIPSSALVAFVGITFLLTWGLIGVYIFFPDQAATRFGEISGSHPFFFLATWSPAISAFVIVFLAVVAPAKAQVGTDLSAGLVATLEDFRARYGFPGATAAIALPDGTVATAAMGLADVEFERGMTPGTPMLAASIGKTFVAATVRSRSRRSWVS